MSDRTDDEGDGDDDGPRVTQSIAAAVRVLGPELLHPNNFDDEHRTTFTTADLAMMTVLAEQRWKHVVSCETCRGRFETAFPTDAKAALAWLPYLITQVLQLSVQANFLTREVATLSAKLECAEAMIKDGLKAAGVIVMEHTGGGVINNAAEVENLDIPEATKEQLRQKLRDIGALGPDKKKSH
jgi:hypothetical protein